MQCLKTTLDPWDYIIEEKVGTGKETIHTMCEQILHRMSKSPPLWQHAFKYGTNMRKSNLNSLYFYFDFHLLLFFSHLTLWFNLRIGKHNVLPSQNNGQKRTLGLLNFNKVLQATFPCRNCFVYFPYGDLTSCLLSTQSCWNHSQLSLTHTHFLTHSLTYTVSFFKINIKLIIN